MAAVPEAGINEWWKGHLQGLELLSVGRNM
jgi:hypothetical protein